VPLVEEQTEIVWVMLMESISLSYGSPGYPTLDVIAARR